MISARPIILCTIYAGRSLQVGVFASRSRCCCAVLLKLMDLLARCGRAGQLVGMAVAVPASRTIKAGQHQQPCGPRCLRTPGLWLGPTCQGRTRPGHAAHHDITWEMGGIGTTWCSAMHGPTGTIYTAAVVETGVPTFISFTGVVLMFRCSLH